MAARIVERPVRRVFGAADNAADLTRWPWRVPAARQLLEDGLELGPLTVLIGENGAGKSVLIEAIAMTYGMSREGGSTGAQHTTRASESELWRNLELRRGVGASRWGFFLRAETMHGFYSYLEQNPGRTGEPRFHEMSHGESFVSLLTNRFTGPGLYILDEPESALSFTGTLALAAILHDISLRPGGQAIVATHSPVLAAVPGARLLEVGDWGLRETSWADSELAQNWAAFFADPDLYFRHLLG